MKTSFCKISPTYYSRQFKYLPDVTPLCAVLMAILLLMLCAGLLESRCSRIGPWLTLPELRNGREQPSCLETLTIQIMENGNVYCGDHAVDTLSQLSSLLINTIKEEKYSNEKVLAQIDTKASFDVVRVVFKAFSEAGIHSVGLVGQTACE